MSHHNMHDITNPGRQKLVKSREDPLERRLRRLIRAALIDSKKPSWDSLNNEIITSSNRSIVVRVLWLFLLAGLLLCFLCQSHERIQYYLSYPVSVDMKIEKNDSYELSTITVCAQNTQEIKNLAQKYNIHLGMDSCINTVFGILKKSSKIIPPIRTDELWNHLNTSSNIISAEIIQRNKANVKLNYETSVLPEGNCRTYYTEGMFPIDERNFRLTLKMGDMREKKLIPGCRAAIISVILTPPNSPHFQYRTKCMGGTVYDSPYVIKQYNFVNSPKKPCLEDGKFYKKCFHGCLMEKLKKLKCRLPFVPKETGLPICMTDMEGKTAYTNAMKILIRTRSYEDCKCIRPCQRTYFSFILNAIGKIQNETHFHFYIKDKYITTVTEYFSYDAIALLCDIGGNLGLYLGWSMLSIVEHGYVSVMKMFKFQRKEKNCGTKDATFRRKIKKILQEEMNHKQKEILKKELISEVTGVDVITDGSQDISLRIMWAFVLFIGLFGFGYFTYHFGNYYRSYPTKNVIEVVVNDTILFPSVTFCGESASITRDKKKLLKLNKTLDICSIRILDLLNLPKYDAEKIWRHSTITKDFDEPLDLKNNIGINLIGNITRSEKYLPEGICFQFAAGKQRYNSGRMTYLTISFSFIPPTKGCEGYKTRTGYFQPIGRSLDLTSTNVNPLGYIGGIQFIIKQMYRENTPTKPCKPFAEVEECLSQCRFRLLSQQIQCRLPYMQHVNKPICETTTDAFHSDKVYRGLHADPQRLEICKCKIRCDELIYIYRETGRLHDFPKSIFVIIPETNLIETITEVRIYNIIKLFCDIGGILGLLLGMSLLSIISLMETFIQYKSSTQFNSSRN